METTHPGNMILQEMAKNTTDMGHESILKPNPSDLPEEELCEVFKIIRISSLLYINFYGLSQGIYRFLKDYLKEMKHKCSSGFPLFLTNINLINCICSNNTAFIVSKPF